MIPEFQENVLNHLQIKKKTVINSSVVDSGPIALISPYVFSYPADKKTKHTQTGLNM